MFALVAAALALASPALARGHPLPPRYTCDGGDTSPPLRWTAPPAGTRSFTLRLIDLDTHPHFVHWYVTSLPPRLRGVRAGTRLGREHDNDFGRHGYGGPCPPDGSTHRYVFELSALDERGHALARARLIVTYRRR
jgi:Raf kinase inhibitor-like YbhB/YbcL family protein